MYVYRLIQGQPGELGTALSPGPQGNPGPKGVTGGRGNPGLPGQRNCF